MILRLKYKKKRLRTEGDSNLGPYSVALRQPTLAQVEKLTTLILSGTWPSGQVGSEAFQIRRRRTDQSECLPTDGRVLSRRPLARSWGTHWTGWCACLKVPSDKLLIAPPTFFYHALLCPTMSYHVLPCPTISYHVLPCPTIGLMLVMPDNLGSHSQTRVFSSCYAMSRLQTLNWE